MVSIIVPVYNSEKYLYRCVFSLLNQTYKNIEIILINDGSTDNSGKICENFAKNDKRVHVINSINEGVSSARNRGLKSAKGDFISFVDSDDYVESNYIKEMIETIKRTKVDIVYCSAIVEDDKGNFLQNEYSTNKLIEVKRYDWNSKESHCVVRGALFPKEIISNLKFDKKLYVGEDTYFFAQCLIKAKYVYCMKDNLYHYVIYNKSLSHGNDLQKLVTEIYAWEKIVDLFKDNSAKVACEIRCKRIILQNRKNNVFRKIYYEDMVKIYKKNFKASARYFFKKKQFDKIIKSYFIYIAIVTGLDF